ncbi:MAG: alpha/beta fold hydrolase [Myxococcota bacterium]
MGSLEKEGLEQHVSPDKWLTVQSADGPRSRLWVTDSLSLNAPILWFQPDLGRCARRYTPLRHAAADHGFRLVLADLRGHGTSTESARGDFGYREMVEFDLLAQRDALRAAFPDAPILAAGHGFGGQLGLLYAARHPTAVQGVVVVESDDFPDGRVPTASALASQLASSAAWSLGRFPASWFGWDADVSRGVVRDLARQMRLGTIRSRGMVYEVDLRRCRTPALFFRGRDSAADTSQSLASKIPSRYRTLVYTDGRGPAGRSLVFRDPMLLVSRIHAWRLNLPT